MSETILILGCGAVGAACAVELRSRAPAARLVLHSRSERRIEELKRLPELEQVRAGCAFAALDLWAEKGALRKLILEYSPSIIVDCVPVANVLATAHQRRAGQPNTPEPFELLSSYVVTCLQAFRRYGLRKLYKVSTAGLGGMGFACPYGHGVNDALDTLDKLKLKVFYAGALHQALVNLDDTPGCDVAVMAPKSLIGWQEEYLASPGEDQGVCIGLGDGTRYTVQELALCSAPSQFGLVSKEEIAGLCADSVLAGGSRGDIVRGVAAESVVPTAAAQRDKQRLMQRMRALEVERGQRRLTNGALGPQATGDLVAMLLVVLRHGLKVSLRDARRKLVDGGYIRADELDKYGIGDGRLGSSELETLEREMVAAAERSGLAIAPENAGELLSRVYEGRNWRRKVQ
ncbi:hypothetical protein WME91_24825 [Sorangium sp. So ce269]